MEVIVNTTLGTYRYEVKNAEDILDLINELMELRHQDNDWEWR